VSGRTHSFQTRRVKRQQKIKSEESAESRIGNWKNLRKIKDLFIYN